jgi:hypothetical protein
MVEQEDLDNLKEKYKEIQQKHNLPSFHDMNKEFSIEKLAEIKSDFLIREIRRFISDWMLGYLRLIESLINPVNVPLFVFSVINTLKQEDKNRLTEIYKKLSKRQVELIELDLNFSEEKEAEFVNQTYHLWDEVKKDVGNIMLTVKKNWDIKADKTNAPYF